MPAIKYTKTAVDTKASWSASEAVKAISNDADASDLRKEYAWVDAEGNKDTKSAYKFPHHLVSDDGAIGAASSKACSAGIAALNGGRGGADIPEADRQGVYNHLAAHLKDADLDPPKLNSLDEDERHKATFSLEANSFVADDASSTLNFPMGQVVSDDTTQRSGTSYDIPSMDLSEFNGSVTADHQGTLNSIIAKTKLRKRWNQVVTDSMQFATKENPLAQVAYDLYKGGYAKDFSIETYGAPEDETGKMFNSKLCGLSGVVTGNNKSATVNTLVRNSLATAHKNGLDTTEAEAALGVQRAEETDAEDREKQSTAIKQLVSTAVRNHLEEAAKTVVEEEAADAKAQTKAQEKQKLEDANQETTNHEQEQDMKFVTVENSRDFAIKVTYKNAAGTDVETELAPAATLDVSEDQKEALEKQLNDAKNPAEEQSAITNAVNTALEAAEARNAKRQEAFEKKILEGLAKEPAFHTTEGGVSTTTEQQRHILTNAGLEDMGWENRTIVQMQNLSAMLHGDPEAAKKVWAINNFNCEEIRKSDKKFNALSITDLGNFVIPPELITKIFGHVSNFQPLLDAFSFQETLSLITSWIVRTGELDMVDVDIQDQGNNEDLKSESIPTYDTNTASLMEFASVTPVDSSALRFSAADIMQDITSMYKRAYDRALSRSIVGRLELAVQGNGQSVPFDYDATNSGNVGALTSMLDVWTPIVEWVPDGVFLMTRATTVQLMKHALEAGPNGPLSNIFTTGANNVPMFFNLPYIIVPSAIMPSLGNTTGANPSWTFEGTTVTAEHAILLANPENFMGRVSGGLNFQVSTEAAYEENGVVKSAFQRDKLVFRGYGYRKSAVTLTTDVAGVTAAQIS